VLFIHSFNKDIYKVPNVCQTLLQPYGYGVKQTSHSCGFYILLEGMPANTETDKGISAGGDKG
jgi:hypothetical protein